MGLLFQLGLIIASGILIQMHLAIMVGFALIGHLTGLETVFQVLGIGYLAISMIGHVRCSYVSFKEMHDPNLLGKPTDTPTNVKEAVSIKNNYLLLGFIWRLSREVDFIKKTINLDFKNN